jgi:hypothetical protein
VDKVRRAEQGDMACRVDTVDPAAKADILPVDAEKADLVAGEDVVKAPRAPVQGARVGRVAASGSISGRRKCVNSASRRWISSTTSGRTFFRSSFRSAARFFPVA